MITKATGKAWITVHRVRATTVDEDDDEDDEDDEDDDDDDDDDVNDRSFLVARYIAVTL